MAGVRLHPGQTLYRKPLRGIRLTAPPAVRAIPQPDPPCSQSLKLAHLATDALIDGSDLRGGALNALAKGGLSYALPRIGSPACTLVAGGLALIALSR
jgi:hypothetical protein